MLTCWKCGDETDRPSNGKNHIGQGFCKKCLSNLKRRITRREKDSVMASLGLVKVRGALGGIYYE